MPALLRRRDPMVYFCAGDHVDRFIGRFSRVLPPGGVLLVGNSDRNYTAADTFFKQSRFTAIYAQNLQEHIGENIYPLPIGLENRHWNKNGVIENFQRFRARLPTKVTKVLVAFSVSTNRALRQPALDWAQESSLTSLAGHLETSEFLTELARHQFVLSPPGNGLDCHRTWEAMYLGTVPIVLRSYAMDYLQKIGLPILVVDTWRDVDHWSPTELDKLYRSLRPKFDSPWLWFDTWKAQIFSQTSS